jgi:DNA-binding transcriptional MerR regulator
MTGRTQQMTTWTVGQVADLFGVTVRTLHHYDEIATLLDGGEDAADHLRRQRATVMTRLDELRELVTAIDRALEREMNEQPATPEEMKELFGDGFTDEYEQEAQERWGDTDAWKQSAARTKRYTKADWAEVKAEMEAVHAALVAALQSGQPATSEVAMDAAEQHRLHIHDRFYDLDHTFHRALADMYVADPRFTKTYEDIAPGLAAYVRDAIHANADRHTSTD